MLESGYVLTAVKSGSGFIPALDKREPARFLTGSNWSVGLRWPPAELCRTLPAHTPGLARCVSLLQRNDGQHSRLPSGFAPVTIPASLLQEFFHQTPVSLFTCHTCTLLRSDLHLSSCETDFICFLEFCCIFGPEKGRPCFLESHRQKLSLKGESTWVRKASVRPSGFLCEGQKKQ